jgi:hypothetical protein
MPYPKPLIALIDYYLQCLAQERRETLTVLESRLEQAILPVPIPHADCWDAVLNSSVVPEVIQRLQGRPDRVAVYAPYLFVGPRGASHEPLAGVVCMVSRGRLVVDPADLWLSAVISMEMSERDLQAFRDALERGVRLSPQAFRRTLDQLIEQEGLSRPQPCADIKQLKQLPEGTIVDFPAFWVVEVETQYDRGLVRELNKLKEILPRQRGWLSSALRFLLEPPAASTPSDEQVLQALANPACPTFSQAVAIAHGLTKPLTVITGPPGTGKTRVITALIIEHLLLGQSVLIASKINTAVDTAVAMVERLVGQGAILRTGNQEARTQLAQIATMLAGWLKWQGRGEVLTGELPVWRNDQIEKFLAQVLSKSRRIRQSAHRLRRLAFPLARAENHPLRWWAFLTRWRLKRFESSWHALHSEMQEMLRSIERWRELRAFQLHRALNSLVAVNQKTLIRLANAMGSDSRARHRVFLRLAEKGYPIAISNLAISTNLPLEPAMFDLLIIDEASTCDPASLLPLLYRARRAVIVGDPQQLPHITGRGWRQVGPVPELRGADGHRFSAEFGTSVYELCRALAGGAEHCLLNDHFRCPPKIISFANARFYGGNLRIHTPDYPDCFEVRLLESHHKGTRTGSRLNPVQQEEAIRLLKVFIQKFPDDTYGIVTPYRAAADALIETVQADSELAPLWREERILIGTAHRFQGNEVDHLIFATIAGSNATQRELRWVEQPNLFNVAITRAKRSLVLLVDRKLWDENALPLARALAETEIVMHSTVQSHAEESILHEISAFLEAHSVKHHINVIYRGFQFDVLDANMPPRWGINLLNWHELQALTPIEAWREWSEIRQLRQHGIELLHVSPLDWQSRLAYWLAVQELGSE